MARMRRRRQPINLRHKVLGFLLTLLGLALMAGGGLLSGYLLDNLFAGNTFEILVFDAFLYLAGLVVLFMAWHQFMVAPQQDNLRESLKQQQHHFLRPRQGRQPADKPGRQAA